MLIHQRTAPFERIRKYGLIGVGVALLEEVSLGWILRFHSLLQPADQDVALGYHFSSVHAVMLPAMMMMN